MRIAVLWVAVMICAQAAEPGLTVELQAQVSSEVIHAGGRLAARPGDSLRVRWSVSNSGKTAAPDVTLHVSLKKSAGGDAAYESALVMDFDAKANASGDVAIQAPGAGDYALRVETIDAAKTLGREAAAEMSVHVQ